MLLRRVLVPAATRPSTLPLSLPRAVATPWLVTARRSLASMQVPIPELGAESIVEGGILSLAKKPGDYVEAEGFTALRLACETSATT